MTFLEKLFCTIFGHKWQEYFQGQIKKRQCVRCMKDQRWKIKFMQKDIIEEWE